MKLAALFFTVFWFTQPCSAALDAAALKLKLQQAAAELEDLDENRAWLARLPMSVEKTSARLAAYFHPGRGEGDPDRFVLNGDIIDEALVSLKAIGVDDERALETAVWFMMPTVMHETQHAIQVDSVREVRGLEVHFIESEIDAAMIGIKTYLQVLAKKPQLARLYYQGKSHNTEALALWRAGLDTFGADIEESYRHPTSPTLAGGPAFFATQAAMTRDMIAELEADLAKANPDDLVTLRTMLLHGRKALEEIESPRAQQATMGYYRERMEAVEAFWSQWAQNDPLKRLENEPNLPAQERARLALQAAKQLSILSPNANADAIAANLERARAAAVESRDNRVRMRAQRLASALEGQRLDYGIDIVRGRSSVTPSDETFAKIVEVNAKHLKTRLHERHFRVFEGVAKDEMARRRG